MKARDARGRVISLLNDDDANTANQPSSRRYEEKQAHRRTRRFSSQRSSSLDQLPPSGAPALSRSASFDSQASQGSISPLTPSSPNEDNTQHRSAGYYGPGWDDDFEDTSLEARSDRKRVKSESDTSAVSCAYDYDGNSSAVSSPAVPGLASLSKLKHTEEHHPDDPQEDHSAKRYPCRYRGQHGCMKTFTTSGHASRHSKIHTAEKRVPCDYPGCPKKFTRSDNMKQHLETHNRERLRVEESRRRGALRLSKGLSSTPPTSPHEHDELCSPLAASVSEASYDALHMSPSMMHAQLPIHSHQQRRYSTDKVDSGLSALAYAACHGTDE